MSRMIRAGLLLAAGWLVVSCGDSSGPNPDPSIPVPVQIGDTVSVRVDSGVASRSFLLRPTSDVDAAIFVQALQAGGTVQLFDSTTGNSVSNIGIPEDIDPSHLLFSRLPVLHLPAGKAWLVQVRSISKLKTARFRLYFYPVNATPEVAPAALVLDDTVTTEGFENTADADEFTLQVTQGEELLAFLKTAPGATAFLDQTVSIYAPGATVPLAGAVGSRSVDDIETQQSTVAPMPSSGIARIVVRIAANVIGAAAQGNGHYQLLVRRLNRAPETASASLLPNDTVVTERIDHVGDIDEFTATLVAGESYRIFLQATDGNPGSLLSASIPGVSPIVVTSTAGDTALADQSTSTFSPLASGPALIRVEGTFPYLGLDRGGYRLFLYHINRAPELVPAAIGVGDSVLGETIEYPGDVDSFTVAAGPTGFVNYLVRHPGGQAEAVSISSPYSTVTCAPLLLGPTSCGGGTHLIPPTGEYLRVGGGQRFYGGYQVRALTIDTLPEGVPPGLALGTRVQEAISPAGDLDRYTVTVAPGDLFDFEFHHAPLSVVNEVLDFAFERQGALPVPLFGGGLSYRSGRFAFPDTGTWRLVVTPNLGGVSASEAGNYDFTLRHFPVTPETAPSALAAIDTVRTEAIDSLGDVDEFTVTAPAGTEMVAAVTPGLHLDALDPTTPDTLRSGSTGGTGIFTVPASGQFRLRVYEDRLLLTFSILGSFTYTGPYTLGVRPLVRAPETVPVTVTRGVDVAGESIDYAGDIDEFSFAGVAGGTVSITLDNLASYGPLHLLLDFVNPQNGSVLTSTDTRSQSGNTSPTVTLPVTGSYLIRVRGISDQTGAGSYHFTVN